jgi:vitellogenic carboxypeptidase-like protein
MIFIDNPIGKSHFKFQINVLGTGFSFTDSEDGYSNNEVEIAQNLYNLLTQFYKVYPDYANNDLYLTGESYAGKYQKILGKFSH